MKKSRLVALLSLIATFVISLTLSACQDVDLLPPVESTPESIEKTDFVAPTIIIDGAKEYIVTPGTTFRLPQITAQDDRDAELISDITVKHGEEEVALTDYAFVAEKSGVYTVNVSVSDMSENVATEEILVHVYGENEINGFDNDIRLNNVTAKGIANLSINTDSSFVRYGEGSLKLEVLQHTNVTWPGIIVSDLPISDISEYYSISFWAYNDSADDITIYLQRNEVNGKAKFILTAHAWTKVEVKARNFDNVFQPMAKSGAEPEVGNCEDLKCFTFHFENKANVPTFNMYIDQIVVNEAAVLDEIDIQAEIVHPVVGQEFTLPVPTVNYGGEVVDANISYVLYDSKYNEIALDGNTHVFTKAGKYVLSISAEYAGFVGTSNFNLICADSRAVNEIEFFESETALNFFKSPHLTLSINKDQHHSANNSTASLKIHSSPSVWPYINMTDLPYSNLEDVAYIYFYAKTDYTLKAGQIAYIGIRDGAQGKVLKRFSLSNDWECIGFTKTQLAELGVTTLEGLQLCVEFYDKSNPANQGGWCPIVFNTYVDNFTVAFVEEPTEKAENVVLDFANYRDLDDVHSSYTSYNFQDLEYTLNNKGSLKVYCAGKWPTLKLGSSFEKFSLEGVKNLVVDVFVPSVAAGHYVRVGANDSHYQKVYAENAGKWVSLYIPVEALLKSGNTLANLEMNFARNDGNDWIDLGTLYIGQIRLDYDGKPVEKHEFTGAETADDVYMFTVSNSDYNVSLNTDPAFVKEGNASIKLNAVPRWPQYFFSQEFIDWLKAEGVESISFDLYIDNAGSKVNVVMMEGLGATSSPKLDQWFTLSIAVDKLTTATKLQFNKDASGGLNVYLDNMKFFNPSKDFSNGETERDLAMFSVQNDLYTVTLNTDAKFVKDGSASIKLSAVPCWPQYFFTQEYIDWLKENGYTYISFELYVDDTTKNLITMEGAYYAPFAMRNEWFTVVLKVADLSTNSKPIQFNKNRAENMDAYLDNVKFYTELPTEFSGDAETLKDLEMFRVENAGSVVSLNTTAQFVKEGSASIKLSAEARWPQFFLSQAYVDWLVAGGYATISFDMYIDAAGSETTVSAMEGAITSFELDKWFTVTLNVADLSSATKIQFNKDAVAPLNVYVDNIKLKVPSTDFTGAETERDLAMFSVINPDYKVTLNTDAQFVKEGSASIKLSAVPRWPQYFFTQEYIDWLKEKGYAYISFELYVDDTTKNLITMEGAYYAPFAMRNEWFTVVLKVADLSTNSKPIQFNKNRAENMDAYLDNVKFYTELPTEFSGDAETLKDLEMFRVENAGSVVSLNTTAQFVKEGSASIKLSAEARWPQFFLSQAYVDWLVAGGYESISFDMYIDAAGSETTVSAMEGAITKFELDKWFTVTLNVADLSSATKIQFNKNAVAPLNVYVDNFKLKIPAPDYTGAESEYDLTMFRVQYGEALTLSTDFVKAGSYSIKMTATPRWPAYYFTQEFIDWLNNNEVDYISFFLYIDQAGSATKVYAMEGAVTSYVVDKWFNVTLKVSSLTTSTMLQFDKNEAAELSVYLDDINYIKGEEIASENEYSDIAMFRVTNPDYKMGDNFDPTYVTAGKYSMKLSAAPRWPIYYFTQEFIDWLKAESIESITFELYIDAAGSATTVSAMEGAVTKFSLDKWFTVTLKVSSLTANTKLQFNKPAANSLNVYLDNLQFTKHVHSYQSVVTEPTCTTAGFTTHTCSCGDSYTDTPVDALGHTEGAAATCTTAQTCTVCGVQLAPALGHTAGAAATCDNAQTCTVCGAELAPALGHSWSATLSHDASGHWYDCSVCGGKKDLSAHDFSNGDCICGEVSPECKHVWNDATCTTAKTCSICGETTGEVLGHSWSDATCTTAKTCSTCGATEGEALGHSWSDATCTTPKTCSTCGATEGEALGHSWNEATCTTPKTCSTCGATEGEALGHNFGDAETECDLAMFSVQNSAYTVSLNTNAQFVKSGNASLKLSAVPQWPQYFFTQEYIDWLKENGYTYISFELYVDDVTNNLITMEGAYYAPFAMRNEWFTVVLKVADLSTNSKPIQFNKNRAENMDAYLDNVKFYTALPTEFSGDAETLKDLSMFRVVDAGAVVSLNTNAQFVKEGSASIKLSAEARWPQYFFTDEYIAWLKANNYSEVTFDMYIDAAGSETTVSAMEGSVTAFELDKWFTVTLSVASLESNNKIQFNKDAVAPLNAYVDNFRFSEGAKDYTGAESEYDLTMFSVQNTDYKLSLNTDTQFVSEGSASIKLNAIPRWPQYYFTQTFIDWLKENGYSTLSFDLYIDNAGSSANVVMMEGAVTNYLLDQWFNVTLSVSSLSTSTRLQFNKDSEHNLNVYLDNVQFIKAGMPFLGEETASDLRMFSVTNSDYKMSVNMNPAYITEGTSSLQFTAVPKWPRYFFTQEFIDWLKANDIQTISFKIYFDSENFSSSVKSVGVYSKTSPTPNTWISVSYAVSKLTVNSYLGVDKGAAKSLTFYIDDMQFNK